MGTETCGECGATQEVCDLCGSGLLPIHSYPFSICKRFCNKDDEVLVSWELCIDCNNLAKRTPKDVLFKLLKRVEPKESEDDIAKGATGFKDVNGEEIYVGDILLTDEVGWHGQVVESSCSDDGYSLAGDSIRCGFCGAGNWDKYKIVYRSIRKG